ncbi:hypothetical protein P7K49_002616 [Saguinus oedipus]|uniref:Uncharacterized protein n=1 Tax=Saguinus oedipus TaxID=9490 RepID=A0ABQ9WID4_SAGOE|nr:hypothetical protein P7K49_002616 [Saguinus oedipus]
MLSSSPAAAATTTCPILLAGSQPNTAMQVFGLQKLASLANSRGALNQPDTQRHASQSGVDLGLEGTLLTDILYRDVAFLNLVDPISHDLLVNLARDLQCPKKTPLGTGAHCFTPPQLGHKQGLAHCWGGVCHLHPAPYSCPEPHSDGTCRCPAASIDTAPGYVAVTSHRPQTPSHSESPN